MPLDDMLKEYAPKTLAAVPEYMWNAVKVNGKVYGVVNQQIACATPNITVPVASIEKYGFSESSYTPGDLSSLSSFVEKVYKDHPDWHSGIDISTVNLITGLDCLAGWNVPGAIDISDRSLKVFNQFENEKYVKAIETVSGWGAKGWTQAKVRITQETDPKMDPKNPTLILSVDGIYKPGGDADSSSFYGFPVKVFPAGKSFLNTSSALGTLTAISRTSKNPERAMKSLEIFNNDQEAFMALNYGIKGKHWDLDADGFVIDGPDRAKYKFTAPYELATNFMAIPLKGQAKDVWEQTKKMNDESLKSPASGFVFNQEAVAEVNACKAIMEEYKRGLSIGFYSMDKYNEFVDKIKKAGSEEIIAEMQKQVDAWKATK